MKYSLKTFAFAMIFPILISSQTALAWGERGHHMVCEAATRLVESQAMKDFLLSRGNIMGHVCNVPDIYWKDLGAISKIGNAAHFMDPENFNFSIETVPDLFADYIANDPFSQDATPEAKADRGGSLWWRSQQMQDLAVGFGKKILTAPTPIGGDLQNKDHDYNLAVYGFMVNLGIMGHFIGDSAMPFHNTVDYDGYATGHGGIHGFYESACVNTYDFKLIDDVMTKAQEIQKNVPDFQSQSAFSLTKASSILAAKERQLVVDADKVIETSQKDSKGLTKPAKRESPQVACPAFRNMIVVQMARGAVALARAWDGAYVQSGRPALDKYRSYRYPFTPDFVGLSYIPKAATK